MINSKPVRAALPTLALAVVASLPIEAANAHAAVPARVVSDGWVRTRDGWERESRVRVTARKVYEPALHPGVLAALLTLGSLLALAAFPLARRGEA